MALPTRRFLLAAAIILASGVMTPGCGPQGPDLEVRDATFRPPLGASDIGVAYFTIRSAQPDRLLRVSSPKARLIEMHASVNEGGVASMQRLDEVDLPAGRGVAFEPGGLHLMVFSPEPIEAGAAFPVTFELESGRTLTADFAVTGGPAAPQHSGH